MPLNPVSDPLSDLLAGSDVDQFLDSLRTTNATIVCADTCVFLDFVRNYFQTGSKAFQLLKMLSGLIAQEKVKLIIPETISQEMWHTDRGNFEGIQKAQRDLITDALKTLGGFRETFQQVTGTTISLPREFDESTVDQLLHELKSAIQGIFNTSLILKQTPQVVLCANSRQVERKRPAQASKNSVGDCLVIETVFAFAECIRARGLSNPLFFLTSNIDDFSIDKSPNNKKNLHPDLIADFQRLKISYSISIQSVIWNL